MFPARSHSKTVLDQWDALLVHLNPAPPQSEHEVVVSGQGLDLASIVSAARHFTPVRADFWKLQQLHHGADTIRNALAEGQVIYGKITALPTSSYHPSSQPHGERSNINTSIQGVNTGFGGSADTRPTNVEDLQRTLIREQHYGILPPHPSDQAKATSKKTVAARLSTSLPNEDPSVSCMPEAWTRASVLIRANSLIRGHSAVRAEVVERMIDLIQLGISPKIPMFGSISASGDLSPLSYIGAAVQGKPNLAVWPMRDGAGRDAPLFASQAFVIHGLTPVKLAAKESLAIVNGTAVSCAAGALAVHDAHGMAVLSQVLTAMTVEALNGTSESFDPLFAEARPHPGQIESAHNIFNFLKDSKLMVTIDTLSQAGTLRQDRYSLRTASQWIGPVLEDLMLAHEQISQEANSTTDNPLVDYVGRVLSGGNFQAKSVTSAMEKVRQGVQTLGRMHFAQCTEMINPSKSRGLPPNLATEDPSESYMFKGVDIGIAALQSELGFLANPVGSHVQTAEMGNQALNSLALISARYTHTALDVLSRLVASHLLAACQALDLRVMHAMYLDSIRSQVAELTADLLNPVIDENGKATLFSVLWSQLQRNLDTTVSLDASHRFRFIAKNLLPNVIDVASRSAGDKFLPALETWKSRLAEVLEEAYINNRSAYLAHGDAMPYLGCASRRMYSFVRDELHVPLLHTALIRTPDELSGDGSLEKEVPTVGSYLGVLYRAIRSGELFLPAMECLREANEGIVHEHGEKQVATNGHGGVHGMANGDNMHKRGWRRAPSVDHGDGGEYSMAEGY